jgi:AcrR family transcriptional regulator
VDAAIHEAVTTLLRDVGYADLTIEAVAQRAGVGHTSIYRRWPSKAHMVHEVVFPEDRRRDAADDVGFEARVRGFAHGVIETMARPEARAALPGIMVDAQADPQLLQRLVDRFEPAARRSLRQAAAEAVARGELRSDADVDRVYDAIVGVGFAMPYLGQRVARSRLADSLVDVLLDGMRTRDPGP